MKGTRFWFTALCCTLITVLVFFFLPHNAYLRYQLLDVGVYAKAKWIYERVNLSETPIDIAFIGTSHTLNGIDSQLVESQINANTDKKRHVVNFAIPHLGRDMHYTLIHMLLQKHTPEAIVLEVRESEARDMHPGTHYIAESASLINAPLIVNLRYAGNLVRQPGRNLKVALNSLFPWLSTLSFSKSASDIADHKNYALTFPDDRTRPLSPGKQKLDEERRNENISAPYKYNHISDIKSLLFFNANNTYVKRIQALAAEKGVDIYYLYLPDYGTEEFPLRNIYMNNWDEMIYPDFQFYQKAEYFNDLGHLNAEGARLMSEFVGQVLSCKLESAVRDQNDGTMITQYVDVGAAQNQKKELQ